MDVFFPGVLSRLSPLFTDQVTCLKLIHYRDGSVMAALSSSWQSQHRDSTLSQPVILPSEGPASSDCPDSAPGADNHVSRLSHNSEPANPNYHFSRAASTRECVCLEICWSHLVFVLWCFKSPCVMPVFSQVLLQPQFIKAESVLLTTLKPDPCMVTTVASPTSLATTTAPVQSTSLQVKTPHINSPMAEMVAAALRLIGLLGHI